MSLNLQIFPLGKCVLKFIVLKWQLYFLFKMTPYLPLACTKILDFVPICLKQEVLEQVSCSFKAVI